jgi:tetratricopeptide (TPR) repeat protein
MRSAAYATGLKLSSAGRHLEAIGCFEQALAENPSDTATLFALGNTAQALGMADGAAQFFRQVLALEPHRIEALVNLANLLRAQGRFAAAAALLQPALARQPDAPELLLTLGSVTREAGDNDGAARLYRAALAARPHYAPALANLADLLADDGAFDEARTLYDEAIKADPGNAQARLNRAILHFLTGNLKDAWRDYAARLDVPGKVPMAVQDGREQRFAAWTGGPLKKARLLVRAEQGVGDQLMFASLFGALSARAAADGGAVVIECEPRLVDLFARSFPGALVRTAHLKTVGGRVTADYAWLKAAGGCTAAIPMGTLPRYLRPTLDRFAAPHAYLAPDAGETARWKSQFGERAIGICWRSGKAGGHRAVQYAPLDAWGAFLKDIPCPIVSTQYDATPDEIAALEAMSGRKIIVPEFDQKNELDRACAMLAALDALVSAPTAVSWLGAGAGVKTLKLLYDTSWTAFGQTYEPFAPSCVCVMPKARGDWRDTFDQTKKIIARP